MSGRSRFLVILGLGVLTTASMGTTSRAEVTAKVNDPECADLLGGRKRIEVVVAERSTVRKLILGGGQYSWTPSTGALGINVPWVYGQEKEWKLASLKVQKGNCSAAGTVIGLLVGASLGAITYLEFQHAVPFRPAGIVLVGVGLFAGGLMGTAIGAAVPEWHLCQ
jgi:hypothetical protein